METEVEIAVAAGLSADIMSFDEKSTEDSLDELSSLIETAGGVCVAKVLQSRSAPDPHSFIGAGKVAELKEIIDNNGCTLAVFDNELSPSQTRALGDELGVRVIDRSTLILDIFAQRAQTKEGRLQVELAQYKYLLPRLTGMWTHLVRQTSSASPIGTRGPGETQLETDRRHIRRKIDKLSEEIETVRKNRSVQRRQRQKNGIPVAALVGYTNAGKSTLLNQLTQAGIHAENRLFDTLDTTTRRLDLSPTQQILISDTVGFINKLPHHLIEAFKATLEELTFADVLLHVIDVSNPLWRQQAAVVEKLIAQLGAETSPCIRVYNKCDLAPLEFIPQESDSVRVSAKTGEGTDTLLSAIESIINQGKRRVVLHLPYSCGDRLELIHKRCEILETNYLDDCTEMDTIIPAEYYDELKQFIFEYEE